MNGIAVYMEGGGQTGEPHTADAKAAVRVGMGEFLRTLRDRARAKQWHWKIVPCGDRATTKNAFLNARAQDPETFALLLVDSETAVGALPKAHLKERDKWDLTGVPEEHVHLMVQVMETWFAADPNNVKAYYGKDFNEGALPKHAQPESVSKPAIEAGLEKATQKTKRGRYHKVRHGSDLLARRIERTGHLGHTCASSYNHEFYEANAARRGAGRDCPRPLRRRGVSRPDVFHR